MLGGLLNFAVVAIPSGRIFIRRFYSSFAGPQFPHSQRTISGEVCEDLLVWQRFLRGFNGISLISRRLSVQHEFATDASGSGFGMIFCHAWSFGFWPKCCLGWSIAAKELYPILLAFQMWGSDFEHSCVLIYSDNQSVVHDLNRLDAKDAGVMTSMMRELVLLLLRHDIVIKAEHLPGRINRGPDLLSRGRLSSF